MLMGQEFIEKPEPGLGMRLEEEPSPARIEAFSDGVFSIVITLLVLDLRVPRDATLHGQTLAAALLQQWPTYLAYVMSFLQVGVVWANHHMMFHHIRRSDHILLVCNLLLLLCTAVLPFTTSLLAEYAYGARADLTFSALLYSGALCCAGLFFNAIWTHALRAGLVHPGADPHRIYALRQHWRLVPVFYGIAFLLAFVDPRLSLGIYAMLLFYYALPGPALVRCVTARRISWVAKTAHKRSNFTKALDQSSCTRGEEVCHLGRAYSGCALAAEIACREGLLAEPVWKEPSAARNGRALCRPMLTSSFRSEPR